MVTSSLKSFKEFWSQRTTLALFIVVLIGVLINVLQRVSEPKPQLSSIYLCHSDDVDSIRALEDTLVSPILYQQVPDLGGMHYKERMQKFIELMVPSILLAREKLLQKRMKVLELDAALQAGVGTERDSIYLESIKKEFKTEDIQELLKRMHPHPVSIILAQAAIESGWGTSRFCREANNIFGIWSYNRNEKRIRASQSRGSTDIYLRKYDSLFESIYDYLVTIGKAGAYKQFRAARLHSENPYRLIWYLSNYSEKRYEYVRSLRNVIEFNDLHLYDTYQLQAFNMDDDVWKEMLDQ